jgi:dipeptidyl aminopeptidase/acylaminoacyl peptidase
VRGVRGHRFRGRVRAGRLPEAAAAVAAVLDAPAPPALSVSPTGEHLLLVQTARYPSIEEVAAPQLRLAGLRINPKTNGPARPPRATGLSLMPTSGGEPKVIALPDNGRVGYPIWAPDGKRFAVLNSTDAGTELWVCVLKTRSWSRVKGVRLNAAIGDAVQWMPDGRSLLVQLVPEGRGEVPAAPAAPAGPVVQESGGKAAPSAPTRTCSRTRTTRRCSSTTAPRNSRS